MQRTILLALALACGALLGAPASAGTIVRFRVSGFDLDVELYDAEAPVTVANFLNYVEAQAYDGTFFHRTTTYDPAEVQIVQGGGFGWNGTNFYQVTASPAIPLEVTAQLSNVRGTIAMARQEEPNTATSQWFFNVVDNLALDPSPGNNGYAVFGHVIGNGMDVINAIAGLPAYDLNQQIVGEPTGPFREVPLIDENYLVMVESVAVVPEPSAMALALLGICGAAAYRRRRAGGPLARLEQRCTLPAAGLLLGSVNHESCRAAAPATINLDR
jgi:peptidyl-prolyl cis-trans isomerase A (cyclophilin A)